MIETKKHSYTPLRYPGGKTSLFEYFASIIDKHGWADTTYIEPYAGGAGAALSLLILGKVERIVINDYDPAIFAFWKSITTTGELFIEKINNTPLTIDEWDKQKKIYKEADLNDPLALGFATFYLNRTNRSGILTAGPIGGRAQGGIWKLDARYNKDAIIEKLRLISLYKDQIVVTKKDGVELIEEYGQDRKNFFYIDPPYFVKGANLYLNAFKIEDHQRLASTLAQYHDTKWLLSYDNTPEIVDLYKHFKYEVFSLKYSAHHNTKEGSELMVFSTAIDSSFI